MGLVFVGVVEVVVVGFDLVGDRAEVAGGGTMEVDGEALVGVRGVGLVGVEVD